MLSIYLLNIFTTVPYVILSTEGRCRNRTVVAHSYCNKLLVWVNVLLLLGKNLIMRVSCGIASSMVTWSNAVDHIFKYY